MSGKEKPLPHDKLPLLARTAATYLLDRLQSEGSGDLGAEHEL